MSKIINLTIAAIKPLWYEYHKVLSDENAAFNSSHIVFMQEIERDVMTGEKCETKAFSQANWLKRIFMETFLSNDRLYEVLTERLAMTFIRMQDGSEFYVKETIDEIVKKTEEN